MRLALGAVKGLLPSLLRPGSDVERFPLEARDLGAVVLWMYGKREYRASRFASALGFYGRALDREPDLAMAALDAGQAASWLGQLADAERFVTVALEHQAGLPPPQLHYARGLAAYLTGHADSAVASLRLALDVEGDWAEAHMALGEVFSHLLPASAFSLDSMAEAEFMAASADTNFSPPLFHLAETAIRRGEVERGGELVRRYRAFVPEGPLVTLLDLMLDCIRKGPASMDWEAAVRESALEALAAAKSLAAAGAQPACAEGGYRAVMRDSTAAPLHWGAVLGLQATLLARGRREQYVRLVDSVIGYRPPTMTLYLLASVADSGLAQKAIEAEAFIRRAFGEGYRNSPSHQLKWTMGVWHALNGDQAVVSALRDDLNAEARNRQARLFATGLTTLLSVLAGDLDSALTTLRRTGSTARRDSLEWQPGESLAPERLLLARALLEHGRYAEAIQVASVFDHSSAVVFPLYLAQSLAVRYRAAVALGQSRLAQEYRARLISLGSVDLLSGGGSNQDKDADRSRHAGVVSSNLRRIK